VTALLLKGQSGATVHLIESDQRKGAFLRAVSRETSAPAQIHIGRIETILPELEGSIEAVSARALAPLSDLVRLTSNSLEKGAKGVFLKGEDWREELTPLEPETNFSFSTIDSRTHPRARLILSSGAPITDWPEAQCEHTKNWPSRSGARQSKGRRR